MVKSTGQVIADLQAAGIAATRRKIEVLIEHQPGLRPALVSGRLAWTPRDIAKVRAAFEIRSKAHDMKEGTNAPRVKGARP